MALYQSTIIIDDFYDDPQEVRARALACDYAPVEGQITFPGRNSKQKLLLDKLDMIVSHLTGEALSGPRNPVSSHGRFRITLAGETSRYLVHIDPTRLVWAGVVYLNLPEQCRGGTLFFRHKELGSDRAPLTPAELEAHGLDKVGTLLARDGNDAGKWEHTMTLPMRFNRLVLYRPWLWHSAGESFGSSLEDGRLVQLMQFVPAGA